MAGLNISAQPPAMPTTMPPGGQPPVAAQPPAAPQQGNEPATPEQQQQYDQFVLNGMKAIYSPQVMPKLLKVIRTAKKPVAGLAQALAMVITRLEDAARQSNAQLAPDAEAHGSVELLQRLAEIAGAKGAGIHDFKPAELNTAMRMALAIYQANRQPGQQPQQQPGQGTPATPPQGAPNGIQQPS